MVFEVYFIQTILIPNDKTAEIAINNGGPFDDFVLNLISTAKPTPGITDSHARS